MSKVYARAAPSSQIVFYVSYVTRGREILRVFLFDTGVKNGRVLDRYGWYSYSDEREREAQVP